MYHRHVDQPEQKKLQQWNRRQLELMGMERLIDGPTTVPELKDLVSDRWRLPHKPCDEVYPKIYLGGDRAANDVELMKRLGVTHVVNVACSEVKTGDMFYISKGHRVALLSLDVRDSSTYTINLHFEEVNRFIEVAMHIGGKVLVHGSDGISRSATFVIAYLMMRKRMSALEAVKTVRRKRHILPNDGFLRIICDLDERLRKDL